MFESLHVHAMKNDREKQLRHYYRRIQEAIDILGGSCVKCGSQEELQFDHVDPQTKLFSIANVIRRRREFWLGELKKCQLLCKPCHTEKTRIERSVEHGGGITGKKNCYCKLCKPLKQEYMKRYN